MDTTKSVKIAAFFSIGLVCFYLLCCFLLPRSLISLREIGLGYDYSLQKFRDIENAQNKDLLFLGSSHAIQGFDPRVFADAGYSSFNLGTTAQTIMNTHYLLDEYGDHLKPKYAVLDIYFKNFGYQAVESTVNLLLNKELNSQALKMAYASKSFRSLNTFFSESLKRQVKPLAEYPQENPPGYLWVEGGYIEKLEWPREDRQVVKKKLDLDLENFQFSYFNKVLEYLKQENIPLLAVVQPLPGYQANLYSKADNHFRMLSEQWGFAYVNYNERLTLDNHEHFMDNNHLSQPGVEIYNRAIIETITELGWQATP